MRLGKKDLIRTMKAINLNFQDNEQKTLKSMRKKTLQLRCMFFYEKHLQNEKENKRFNSDYRKCSLHWNWNCTNNFNN